MKQQRGDSHEQSNTEITKGRRSNAMLTMVSDNTLHLNLKFAQDLGTRIGSTKNKRDIHTAESAFG